MKKRVLVFYSVWIMVLLFLMWRRLQLGVDLTDESVYVTWAYRVFRGDVPILETRDPQLLGSLIMLPFMKVFTIINHNFEGIIYFMRILYWLLTICGYLFIAHILDKRFSSKLSYIAALPVIFSAYASLFSFSYNTVSLFCANIAFFSCFGIEFPITKKDKRYIILSGVMHTLAAFSYPPLIILCILNIGVYYIYFRQLEESSVSKRSILLFVCSGLITALIIVLLFVLWAKGDVIGLIKGGLSILDSPYRRTSIPLNEIIKNAIWGDIKNFLVTQCFGLVVSIVLSDILYKKTMYKTIGILKYILYVILFYILFAGIVKEGFSGLNLLYVVLLLLTIYKIFSTQYGTIKVSILYSLLLPYILVILLRTFSSNNGSFFMQTYAALPLVVLIPFTIRINSTQKNAVCPIVALFLSTMILCTSYLYIYRDGKAVNLNSKVHKGIYKHLYTTEKKLRDIEHLELELSKTLDKHKTLMVANHFPAIYLMSGMIPVTPDVWDSFYGNHGYVDAANVFEYFESTKKTPDTIVFVEYDGNKYYRYEDPKYELNQYIYAHYILKYVDKSEAAYRITVLERNTENTN